MNGIELCRWVWKQPKGFLRFIILIWFFTFHFLESFINFSYYFLLLIPTGRCRNRVSSERSDRELSKAHTLFFAEMLALGRYFCGSCVVVILLLLIIRCREVNILDCRLIDLHYLFRNYIIEWGLLFRCVGVVRVSRKKFFIMANI